MDYIWIVFLLNLNNICLYWLTDTVMMRIRGLLINETIIFSID